MTRSQKVLADQTVIRIVFGAFGDGFLSQPSVIRIALLGMMAAGRCWLSGLCMSVFAATTGVRSNVSPSCQVADQQRRQSEQRR